MRLKIIGSLLLVGGLLLAAAPTAEARHGYRGIPIGGHYFRPSHHVRHWGQRPSFGYHHVHRPHYYHHFSRYSYGFHRPHYYGFHRPFYSNVYVSVRRPYYFPASYYYSYSYVSPSACYVYPTGFYGYYGYSSVVPSTVVNVRTVRLASAETPRTTPARTAPVAVASRVATPTVVAGRTTAAARDERPLVLVSAAARGAEATVDGERVLDRALERTAADAASAERKRGLDLMLDLGDRLFAARMYPQAADQYRAAIDADAAGGAAYFRAGHALTAAGRYREAATAFKRGIAVDADYVRSGVRLQQLYRSQDESTAHVEKLAAAALENPQDSDLMFLIGAFLHFEGQPERAGRFFRQAAATATAGTEHIQAFLDADQPATTLALANSTQSF